ncbi:hypothetical protein BCR42DRAFT_443359 [Absidia repens]|uniref:Uncharacterized protein n=1 Tax=Absidia repens TaxID=90262 RepID=A0A1X2HZU2_9FUNG|nr:hypothetical protein BCR42DRAFT_443359 [Absidia repens]
MNSNDNNDQRNYFLNIIIKDSLIEQRYMIHGRIMAMEHTSWHLYTNMLTHLNNINYKNPQNVY